MESMTMDAAIEYVFDAALELCEDAFPPGPKLDLLSARVLDARTKIASELAYIDKREQAHREFLKDVDEYLNRYVSFTGCKYSDAGRAMLEDFYAWLQKQLPLNK